MARTSLWSDRGERRIFAKISEFDILRFAEIRGDFSPIQVDEAFSRSTSFDRRIVHGALLMGLSSTTSAIVTNRSVSRDVKGMSVSLDYGRIRIIRPDFTDDPK
jgi:3-hydroxybutyryl-CoA dehydratase